MGHRAGISILAMLFAFISMNVNALGLGDISLKSKLNQPLRAEIELLETRDLSKAEILVGLATQEDFNRIGVDRVYFLTDLRFEVDLQNKSGPVIRVESKKLVREPYLNFVVIAQWPSGKLLREYTVLMDLPVFSEQAPAAVRAPSSGSSSQPPPTRTTRSSSRSQSSTQANPRSSFDAGRQSTSSTNSNSSSSNSSSNNNSKSSYSAGDEYTIQRNDTLWDIALAVRPSRDVSVQQAMLALKKANPDAFINNNINLLKRGKILRVPSRDAMASRGASQALNDFAREANQPVTDDVSAAPLEGRKSYSSFDESTSDSEGRVKLSSPDNASSSSSGSSSGSENNTSTKALESELSSTMEELDKANLENGELKSKVSALEEQIKTMERMIEVSNEGLRSLELAAQKSKDDAQAAAEQLVDQESVAQEQAAKAEAMLADSEVAVDGVLPEVNIEDGAIDSSVAGEGVDEAVQLTDSEQVVQSSADEEFAALEAEQEAAKAAAEAAEKAAAEAAELAKAKAATPTPAPVKSKGIMSLIMDNLMYIGLLLLALIGLVFFLVKKVFSKDEINEDDEFLEPGAYEEDGFAMDSTLDTDVDEIDALDLMGEEDHGEPESEVDVELDEQLLADEDLEEISSDPQTEDVVAEADIYIAYGKYDQAEDMLLKALESSPFDHDARLKLLEAYAAQQNIEGFDPHFAMIVATGDHDLTSRAEHLRSTIADAPVFNSADYDTGDFEALFDGDSTSDNLDKAIEEDIALGDVSDDTVVNFRGNVAADNEEFSLDLDEDSLGSFEDALSVDDSEGLSLDTLEEDADGAFEDEISLDLSGDDESSDEEPSLSLDLDDSDDFDLGELNLTDDLDDDLDINLDASIESATEDKSLETDDFDLDLDDLDEGFDASETDKPTTDDDIADLAKSLDLGSGDDLADLDLSGVSDGLDLLGEDDTLVLDVDDSLKDLEEAGERLEPSVAEPSLPGDASESDEGSLDDLSLDDLSLDDGDLSLDDDLDLSSLDDDLKALSKDLDGDFDEVAMLKELDDVDLDLGDEAKNDLEDDFLGDLKDDADDSSPKEPSAVMEEPITDFDEPDSSEGNADAVEGDTKAVIAESDQDEEDDFLLPDIDPEGTDEDDLDFMSDSDETATKLDLARAYIDMGDEDGAKDILDEIIKEGNDQHKKEADELMKRIDD